jgi:hypothetical protein
MKHAMSVTDSLLQRFIKSSATVLRKETIAAKQEDLLIRELTTVQPYTEQLQRHFTDFLRCIVTDTYSSHDSTTTAVLSSDDTTNDTTYSETSKSETQSKRSNSVAQGQLNEAQVHSQVVSVTILIIAGYCKIANMVSEGQSLAAYKMQALINGRATRAILHKIWLVSVHHYQYCLRFRCAAMLSSTMTCMRIMPTKCVLVHSVKSECCLLVYDSVCKIRTMSQRSVCLHIVIKLLFRLTFCNSYFTTNTECRTVST